MEYDYKWKYLLNNLKDNGSSLTFKNSSNTFYSLDNNA